MATADELRASSLDDLERLYRQAALGPIPRGRFRGEALARVGSRFARSPLVTAMLLPFERARFGIDFGARTWFFVDERVTLGRFRVDPGRSRWRETETLRLRYDVSRLPIRALLYDEVKPLDESLCLGLGGVALPTGRGDLFFFLLEAEAGSGR
jgi:hypothetical protein